MPGINLPPIQDFALIALAAYFRPWMTEWGIKVDRNVDDTNIDNDNPEEANLVGGDTGTPTEFDDNLDDLHAAGSVAGESRLDHELFDEARDDDLADLHLPEDDMHVETVEDLRRESERSEAIRHLGEPGHRGKTASASEMDLDAELDELDNLDLELDEEVVEGGYDDAVAEARRRLTVAELMHRLIHQADEVSLRDLFVLSDLSRVEMEEVERNWNDVPVVRRRRLVEWLVESASERLELLLGRVLRIALRDEDARVRILAISGLWEEVEPDLLGPLTHILRTDEVESVRAAAASALGAFVLAGELDELDAALAMRAEEALLAAYQSAEESISVQARALESLAYSGEAGLRQMIEDAYYASDEELRIGAVRAMGRSADTRWRAMVRAELSSPDANMRAEAARATGELETSGAVPELISMLQDDITPNVRIAVIEALGHLGGREARDVLREIAASGEESEMRAAEDALDEMLLMEEESELALLEEADDADDEDEDDTDDDYFQRGRRSTNGNEAA